MWCRLTTCWSPYGSMSVEGLETLCAEAVEALVPRAWNLKPDILLSSLHLMCDLRNPNLSCIQF